LEPCQAERQKFLLGNSNHGPHSAG
jgi:hypothetical protein